MIARTLISAFAGEAVPAAVDWQAGLEDSFRSKREHIFSFRGAWCPETAKVLELSADIPPKTLHRTREVGTCMDLPKNISGR